MRLKSVLVRYGKYGTLSKYKISRGGVTDDLDKYDDLMTEFVIILM